MLTPVRARKCIDKSICYAIFFLFVLLLGGCGSSRPEAEPGSVQITLIASDDINLNSMGKPAPLNVILYELKSSDNFANSDYFSIYEGETPALKKEAVKIYEAILTPGETRTIHINSADDSEALGIIAAYRDINKASWNRVVEMKDIHKKKNWLKGMFYKMAPEVKVHFNTLDISIDKMD